MDPTTLNDDEANSSVMSLVLLRGQETTWNDGLGGGMEEDSSLYGVTMDDAMKQEYEEEEKEDQVKQEPRSFRLETMGVASTNAMFTHGHGYLPHKEEKSNEEEEKMDESFDSNMKKEDNNDEEVNNNNKNGQDKNNENAAPGQEAAKLAPWARDLKKQVNEQTHVVYKDMGDILKTVVNHMQDYVDTMGRVHATWNQVQRHEHVEAARLERTEDNIHQHVQFYQPSQATNVSTATSSSSP